MTIAATPGSRKGPGGLGQAWARFREWRQSRPFWGSVVAIIGGIEIYLAAAAPMAVVVMQGLPGLLTMAIFLITVALAGVTLFQPHLRSITGLLILILGPLSIMATNLGGFVIGMVMLVIGGGLILAWAPEEDALDLEYIAGERRDDADVAVTSPSIDPIPSSGLSGAAAPVSSAADAPVMDAAPVARTAAGPRPPGAKPRTKRPAPAPRSGLAGVLDTMFGTRRSSAKPGQARKSPAGKRPAGSGPRPAGKRPAGSKPRPSSAGPSSTGPSSSGSGGSGSGGSGSVGSASGGSASGGSASPTASLSSIERPADPTTTNARTWIAVPLILVALATPAAIAWPASAAPTRPVSEGPLDWLFPPAAPTSAPAPTASATPAATPSPGFSLPSLDDLLNPAPTPTGGTTPVAPVTPVASAPECPGSKGLTGTTSGGQPAIDAAAALQACAAAAQADDSPAVKADAADGDFTVSDERLTLKATRMEMEGFAYDGIATVQSAKGPLETLHFSADSIKIDGMDQSNPFVGGSSVLKNIEGSAILKGKVELYVTSFKSNVFGLVPLTFTVDGLQPPLVLPSMFFTDATSVIAFVKCDQILLPDLELKVTGT